MLRLASFIVSLLLLTSFLNGQLLPSTSSHIEVTLPDGEADDASLPTIPIKNSFHVEHPKVTLSGYKLSANNLRIPSDITTIISRSNSIISPKSIDINAVNLHIEGTLSFRNIPNVRILAHVCVFSTPRVTFDLRTHFGTHSPPGSGTLEIFCSHIIASDDTRIETNLSGADGRAGRTGLNGVNGKDGTPARRGSCKKGGFVKLKCKKDIGSAGEISTNGTDGKGGGHGGHGGHAGDLRLSYRSISNRRVSLHIDAHGGNGGAGGAGGQPGKNGKFIPNGKYVESCTKRFDFKRKNCAERLKEEERPPLRRTLPGAPGVPGKDGEDGSVLITPNDLSRKFTFSVDDLLDFVGLAERYYNDVVLAKGDTDVAMDVMDTIIALARMRSNDLLNAYANRAEAARKTVTMQQSVFGPALLSRTAPINIDRELRLELRYAEAIRDNIGYIRRGREVSGVLLDVAAISIPGTSYRELHRNLRAQRDTFQQAVHDLESRITHASSLIETRVEAYINAKKAAAETAKTQALFKAAFSLVKVGIGLVSNVGGAIKSVSTIIGVLKSQPVTFSSLTKSFGKNGELSGDGKALLNNVTGIKDKIGTITSAFKKADEFGCNYNDIKGFLVDAPDRIDKFPNLVDFESDFSKIRDIGVVTDLSKALLATRASSMTGQFSCVIGENLVDSPAIKAAVDNYFILAASRLEILGRMVDIDIELAKVKIAEEGVKAQIDRLRELQFDVRLQSPGASLTLLTMAFDYARMRTVETFERLADAYGNIVLRDMEGEIVKYAQNRLAGNGELGYKAMTQYANLLKLELALKRQFRTAHRCTKSREVPSTAFYSFDLTPGNSPDLFNGSLRTGPRQRSSLVLDIEENCAFYAGDHPLPRRYMNLGGENRCILNRHRYNARLVSIAVELLGGDDALLPAGRSAVDATLDQAGRQEFHAKPGKYVGLDVAPLQFWLGYIPVRSGSTTTVRYHKTCYLDQGGLDSVNVDVPRVCPSPFSSYALQIGAVEEVALHPFLSSVRTIRVHMEVVAMTRSSTAEICYG